jgi:hypothetical protein
VQAVKVDHCVSLRAASRAFYIRRATQRGAGSYAIFRALGKMEGRWVVRSVTLQSLSGATEIAKIVGFSLGS